MLTDVRRDTTRSFSEYGGRRHCLICKQNGENMKRSIAVLACVVFAQFLFTREAVAFPGERIFNKTVHFAYKAGQKIDRHVIQPGRRAVVRHLPG
jgi:hypothetical protein